MDTIFCVSRLIEDGPIKSLVDYSSVFYMRHIVVTFAFSFSSPSLRLGDKYSCLHVLDFPIRYWENWFVAIPIKRP